MRKTLTLFIAFIISNTLFACTTFFINTPTQKVFGRNYDWMIATGQIIENKRGLVKKSMVKEDETGISWTSKYGSMTFNQFGKEFPLGGMNEKGLVVEVLWLEEAKYPAKDARKSINELQWIQYQLDNYSSVAEVIKSDKFLRINSEQGNLHYMLADKSGNSATIEFIDGKTVITQGQDLAFKVLTNNTMTESKSYLNTHTGFGGNATISKKIDSKDRYVRTCKNMKTYKNENAVEYAFKTLQDVTYSATVWSIVYDMTNMKVYFKTEDNTTRRSFTFSNFDFNCSSTIKTIDMNTKSTGNLNKVFVSYSYEKNKQFIETAFEEIEFLADVPREFIDRLIIYPKTVKCK
jgi:penicillin V acylase-like amidase (Ntn superfamily)